MTKNKEISINRKDAARLNGDRCMQKFRQELQVELTESAGMETGNWDGWAVKVTVGAKE